MSPERPGPFREKRSDIRHPCSTEADLWVGPRRFHGRICNESRGGFYVETAAGFHIGQEILVVYTSPAGLDFRRSATIANLRSNGVGVRFKYPGYNR
jgi:hypothetical protein